MASVTRRYDNWRVLYRYRGSDPTAPRSQSRSYGTEGLARRIARIAEADNHRITIAEIEQQIGLHEPEETVEETPTSTLPTLREWSETWLKSRTRISTGTLATYRGQFRREILPALGDEHLDRISGVDVAALLNTLRAKFTDATVTRYYSALHACLAFAVVEGLIGDNPARRTDFIRDLAAHDDPSDEGDQHVYLTWAEYEIILGRLADDARPLVEFLAGTGARFSEATAVAVEKFELTRKPKPAVRIHRAWKHDGHGRWYLGATKGREKRTVPVAAWVVEALAPLVEGQPPDALLFRSPKGHPISYHNFRDRRWEPAITAAMRCAEHPPDSGARRVDPGELVGPLCRDNGGVRHNGQPCGAKVWRDWNRCRTHIEPPPDAVSTCDCPTRLQRRPTLHDLRHSHVAWLIVEGRPIVSISRRIGHHSTTVTESTYAGLLPEVTEADADALDVARRRGARRVV